MGRGTDFFDHRFIFENDELCDIPRNYLGKRTKNGSDPCLKDIEIFSTADTKTHIKVYNIGSYPPPIRGGVPDPLPPVHLGIEDLWRTYISFDDSNWRSPIYWPNWEAGQGGCQYYRDPATPLVNRKVQCIWGEPANEYTAVLFRHIFALPPGKVVGKPIMHISLDDDAIWPRDGLPYDEWTGYFCINDTMIHFPEKSGVFDVAVRIELDPNVFKLGDDNLLTFEVFDYRGDYQALMYHLNVTVNTCDEYPPLCESTGTDICIKKGSFALPSNKIVVPPAYSSSLGPDITIEHLGRGLSYWNRIINPHLNTECLTTSASQTRMLLCAHERDIRESYDRIDYMEALVLPRKASPSANQLVPKYGIVIWHSIYGTVYKPWGYQTFWIGLYAAQVLIVPRDSSHLPGQSQLELAPYRQISPRNTWNLTGSLSNMDPGNYEFLVDDYYRNCMTSRMHLEQNPKTLLFQGISLQAGGSITNRAKKTRLFTINLSGKISFTPVDTLKIATMLGYLNKYGEVVFGDIELQYNQ